MSDDLAGGSAVLGIELGSTRIKMCLLDGHGSILATSSHDWENQFVDRMWTYAEESIWDGLRNAYRLLAADVEGRFGVVPKTYRAIGVSAMMHGYLALDASGDLLVPFRTWRNTSTGEAAAELSALFGHNIPLRWSVAHLYQAILDREPHVARLASLTTLAGYVHHRLTETSVVGIGDASGIFPIDVTTGGYDQRMLGQFDALVADRLPGFRLAEVLPEPLPAGREAGRLTSEGASLLDPSGTLQGGAMLCPPEGDAGTGMVATNSVRPRSANVSVGTSIFAMVVLERPLNTVHDELDLVTTPAGDLVAMVHCNNGASELGAWAGVFHEFATALGKNASADEVFGVLLHSALAGESDAGGLLAYNYLSGEPITGLPEGRPAVIRTPDSRLTLANFMRAQVYSTFATLSIGMRVLASEGVEVDSMFAHGGLFRTADIAQRLLAAAVKCPVSVGRTAGEGGAWGIALLASFLEHASHVDLPSYLDEQVFAHSVFTSVSPNADDIEGFGSFLDRYTAGLQVEIAAVQAL